MGSDLLLKAWHALSIAAPLFIAWGFARSLLPGQTALITRIGEASRGPLTPEMRRYTQRLTALWAWVCAALGGFNFIATLQPGLAPLWLLMSLPALLVPVLFVGEFYYRKQRFPEHNHPGFLEYLRIIGKHYRA